MSPSREKENLIQNIKPKRIVIHGCYSASNHDLRIKDKYGRFMKGSHDVFVISKSSKNGFVKVKTITSLENENSDTYKQSTLSNVKKGRIIPIPNNELKSNKLSGIHLKPILIHKSKLFKSKHNFKYPSRYNSLISIDKR